MTIGFTLYFKHIVLNYIVHGGDLVWKIILDIYELLLDN